MSKRRRTSSVASRSVEEDESDSQQMPEPSRKKRKFDPVSNIYYYEWNLLAFQCLSICNESKHI